MHRWNYKIYSYLARIGDMARARRDAHQVIKFRIILIHGRRRCEGITYRVPDTSADTGHVESGCRQHLEVIRHWKRPSATGAAAALARRDSSKVAAGEVYPESDYDKEDG